MSTPNSLIELSKRWNEAGRAYFGELSARLARFYGGEGDVDLDLKDPRDEEVGDRVMRAVIDLAAAGQWQRARELFDPAYAPLMGWIKQSKSNYGFVTILGPDELLVRRGRPWQQEGTTFHLRGGRATVVDDVRAVCRSRGRDFLVLARSTGLELRDARGGLDGLRGPPLATVPWPTTGIFRPRGITEAASAAWGPPGDWLQVEQLAVSDDGKRIVVSCHRQGILLASLHPGEEPWRLLWPDARPPWGKADGDEAPRPGDMTHVAMSRDGRRLAFGCQDAGHFLAEVSEAGEPSWYATVGHLSEYPHFAYFSDDGRHVALNSCHFYAGATVAFDWEGNRGKTLSAYEQHAEAPCIDGDLRLYAACWLDRPVLSAVLGREAKSPGAFLLAGSGIMRLCTPTGALGMVQGFGSSACAIDYCPESRRLALASYSGFVHLYDPFEEELPGRVDGFRPRRELARWILWDHLPNGPLRW
jgi:hypothetical protein